MPQTWRTYLRFRVVQPIKRANFQCGGWSGSGGALQHPFTRSHDLARRRHFQRHPHVPSLLALLFFRRVLFYFETRLDSVEVNRRTSDDLNHDCFRCCFRFCADRDTQTRQTVFTRPPSLEPQGYLYAYSYAYSVHQYSTSCP